MYFDHSSSLPLPKPTSLLVTIGFHGLNQLDIIVDLSLLGQGKHAGLLIDQAQNCFASKQWRLHVKPFYKKEAISKKKFFFRTNLHFLREESQSSARSLQ